MPRLPPSLIRRAHGISPCLAAILPACRDLPSALQELQWIRQHVNDETHRNTSKQRRLFSLCRKRGKGVPLQYILGSQPFGNLDIKCRPGVLIPRPETEAYTSHLSRLLINGHVLPGRSSEGELSILDLCAGTGCISLHLFSCLQNKFPSIRVRGVDVSPVALNLAQENFRGAVRNKTISPPTNNQSIEFISANIFDDGFAEAVGQSAWDILISNPPYVSRAVWRGGRGQLGYSVRKYEPKLALVPPDDVPTSHLSLHEDAFYDRLLTLYQILQPRMALFEIGDGQQADRVVQMAVGRLAARRVRIELWNDWPEIQMAGQDPRVRVLDAKGSRQEIKIVGSGNPRAVVILSPDAETPAKISE